MNGQEELTDKDPFADHGESLDENLITEAMVKKATYLIHKLANLRKQDYKEIQKKCKKLFDYSNLAKVTIEDGHKIIDKLIELTGGEEEPSNGAPIRPDNSQEKPETGETAKPLFEQKDEVIDQEDLESKIGKLAEMLQICVADSKEIVEQEIGSENVTEGTRAILIKSFAATLFIQASKEGLGR